MKPPLHRIIPAGMLLPLLFLSNPGWAASGIPVRPDAAVIVTKVPATDCRVVRGFFGVPVDGSVRSWDYRGETAEYPERASDGVHYSFNNNDGVHITLRDGLGFDAVVLRGGAHARMYADANSLTEPDGRKPSGQFPGGGESETLRFDRRLKAGSASFFGVDRGKLAEVSFYRISADSSPNSGETWTATGVPINLPGRKSKY
ncbi:MAG: hypothetical protein ACYC9O_18190, partial [Candidatus Latescibacterota bacterium]